MEADRSTGQDDSRGSKSADERSWRALIVDDVPAMRQFLRLVLRAVRTLSVDEAGDGLAALQLWTKHNYDVILLDLNLPLLDGLKFLASIRSAERLERNVPIIVVSTVTDAETMDRVRELGVTHVLPKPVEAVTIVDAVREALRLPELDGTVGERRQSRRLQMTVSLSFDHGETIETRTWDMSPTGAFIVSNRPWPLQARGRLRLDLRGAVVEVECEVAHVRPRTIGHLPSGFGVRFLNLGTDHAMALRELFTSPA